MIALIPAPEGLAQHTWYYFAIFAGVIVGLMIEPIPGAAIALIAVTVVAVFSEFQLEWNCRSQLQRSLLFAQCLI